MHGLAIQFHKTQLALHMGFTCSLMVLLWAPTLPYWPAAAVGAALAASVGGLVWQHHTLAERYDAPRSLWTEPPYNHLAFANQEHLAWAFDIFISQHARLQEGLERVTQKLAPLRRLMLQSLFACAHLPVMQMLFVTCARHWLAPQKSDVWRTVHWLEDKHTESLRKLWASRSWALQIQLNALNASVLPKDAAQAMVDGVGATRISLKEELADFVHTSDWERRLFDAEKGLFGPAALMAQKVRQDKILRALVWVGRSQHDVFTRSLRRH